MNTLYFRGKQYPARRLANKVVEVVAGFGTGSRMNTVQLIEEDLQVLALMKYTGCIVRNHPDTLSTRVRNFLEAIAPGAVVPVSAFRAMHHLVSTRPPEFLADQLLSRTYKVQECVVPVRRRIPHVKLVKAASLVPGMSIARWLMADDVLPGRCPGRVLDVRNKFELGGQTYLNCTYKRNLMEFNSPAVPYSLWLAPQQLVPVLTGWRNKAVV